MNLKKMSKFYLVLLFLFSCSNSRNVIYLNNIEFLEVKGSDFVTLGEIPIKVKIENFLYNFDSKKLKITGSVYDYHTYEQAEYVYCIRKNGAINDTILNTGKGVSQFSININEFDCKDTLIIGAFSFIPRYYTIR